MTAWLIFSGTIALSYLFFIRWRPVPGVQVVEYVPLYVLLLASTIHHLRPKLRPAFARFEMQKAPTPQP